MFLTQEVVCCRNGVYVARKMKVELRREGK